MSAEDDFDPKAYLREKAGGDFDPKAYLAAKATPATPEGPSGIDALARGAGQGITAGFQDEASAATAPVMDRVFKHLPDWMMGTENRPPDSEFSAKAYRERRDYERSKDSAAQSAHGGLYLAGQLAGGLASTPLVPGGLAGAVGYGAASGLGGSEADVTKGELARAALDTGIGATVGAAAHGLAAGAGALANRFGGRAAAIEEGLAQSAANKAAGGKGGTATAASEAGRSSADVARQLDKIELYKGSAPDIYKQMVDSGSVQKLEREYMEKIAEELPGKVSARNAAKAAYADAIRSEPDRAAQIFDESMSVTGALRPLAKSLKKYAIRTGVGAALGAAGGGMSGHGREGAAIGAAGLNLAMAPTVIKHATSPAVRRLALSLAAKGLGFAAQEGPERVLEAGAVPMVEGLAPELPWLQDAIRAAAEADREKGPDAMASSYLPPNLGRRTR